MENTFEMRCLSSILGVTLLNRLRNESIRNSLGVKSGINKGKTKWFGHVARPHPDGYVNTVFREDLTKKQPRGRLKKRRSDQFPEHLRLLIRTLRVSQDRGGWKRLTKMKGGARILRGLRR